MNHSKFSEANRFLLKFLLYVNSSQKDAITIDLLVKKGGR